MGIHLKVNLLHVHLNYHVYENILSQFFFCFLLLINLFIYNLPSSFIIIIIIIISIIIIIIIIIIITITTIIAIIIVIVINAIIIILSKIICISWECSF